LGDRFVVEEVFLGGLGLYPLLYLFEKALESFCGIPLVQKDYRLLRRIRAWDYRCRWGRWAYNIALRARKRNNESEAPKGRTRWQRPSERGPR